jgi:hypothetical protein
MLRIQNSLQKLLGGKKARSEAWLFLNGTPVITSSIGWNGNMWELGYVYIKVVRTDQLLDMVG